MRFAAIADIHGNLDALEAVLADIASCGITDIVNLGDHVSGPFEPARTADALIDRNFPSIRGDQDRILVELHAAGASQRADLRQLERRHIDWLAQMPATLWWRDEVFLCHAAPHDDAAFWLDHPAADGSIHARDVAEIAQGAAGIDASLILCAHTHIPRVLRLKDGRMIVNPGSVGLPGYEGTAPVRYTVETGTPDACYAILDRASGGGWSVTVRYVPYDTAPMAARARAAGMPAWASAVATGWVRQAGEGKTPIDPG